MDINSSSGDTIRKEYERGEDSYLTPQPPTPDTYVTNTLSCPTLDQEVLYGDFDIETKFKCLPQLTLAIIKPDGMKYVKEIEKKIKDAGFDVVQVSFFFFYHFRYAHFLLPLLLSSSYPS